MSLLDEFLADTAVADSDTTQSVTSSTTNTSSASLSGAFPFSSPRQQPYFPGQQMMVDDDGASSTTTDEASSSGASHLNSINTSHARLHQDHDALSTTSSMSTFSSGSYSHFVPDFSSNTVLTPQTPSTKPINSSSSIITPIANTSFSSLLQDASFNNHMVKIKEFIKLERSLKTGALLPEDEEYPYIMASNTYTLTIDQEIDNLFIQLKGLYADKFKDLENNVSDPITYVKTVLRIGNATPLDSRGGVTNTFDADLSDLLPPSTIMILKVTATYENIFNVPLSDDKWRKIDQLCRDILQLAESKEMILEYVSMKMVYVAPNLSTLIGARIAAQLIGAAGGLTALSQTSADAIQCLGREKKGLEGMSSKTFMGMLPKRKPGDLPQDSSTQFTDLSHMRHTGFVGLSDLVIEHTPPRDKMRKKVARIVATKCALAARIDSCNSSKDGTEGGKLREDVMAFIKKLLEPPKRKEDKPLAAPDGIKKNTNRGGGKSKLEKEISRYSELRKKHGRLAFGEEGSDDSYIGDGSGGMLKDGGARGLGQNLKLKNALLSVGQKHDKSKKKDKQNKTPGGASSSTNLALSESAAYFDGISTISNNSIFKSGTATQIIRTGTATSMAINEKNEMELLNPSLIDEEKKKKTEKKNSYFSADTKFKKNQDTSMAPPSDLSNKKRSEK